MARAKTDVLYRCIESFVAAGEPETPSYSRGMCLAGSHPAVRRPGALLPKGSPRKPPTLARPIK